MTHQQALNQIAIRMERLQEDLQDERRTRDDRHADVVRAQNALKVKQEAEAIVQKRIEAAEREYKSLALSKQVLEADEKKQSEIPGPYAA